jgi:hypothetical protein
VLPHWAFDVVAEMGHPVGRPDKRRSLPRYRVREANPVGCAAERDVLTGRRRLSGQFGGGLCRGVRDDRADELVAPAAHSSDVALRLAVVTECTPSGLDAARQRRLADEAPAPHGVEKLLFRDEPVGIADQLREYVEHLRLDADHLTGGAQLVALGVEDKGVEAPHAGFCW